MFTVRYIDLRNQAIYRIDFASYEDKLEFLASISVDILEGNIARLD